MLLVYAAVLNTQQACPPPDPEPKVNHRTPFAVMQTMSRIKAADKVSFPLEINLDSLVTPDTHHHAHGQQNGHANANGDGHASESGDSGQHVYDLAAILIHKGGSATSGHYGEQACR